MSRLTKALSNEVIQNANLYVSTREFTNQASNNKILLYQITISIIHKITISIVHKILTVGEPGGGVFREDEFYDVLKLPARHHALRAFFYIDTLILVN